MHASEGKLNLRFLDEADSALESPRTNNISPGFNWFGALHSKVVSLFQARVRSAQERFKERTEKALSKAIGELTSNAASPWELWTDWSKYAIDFWQRTILFWDGLRRRGNAFMEHERAGKPPMLHFDHEVVLDARKFKRPVNYALLRIIAPKGVTVDPKRRPYVIIDPRAGHGPGVGGFKDDSQVGVALHDGHPVYFVIFFPDPVPGQTLLDVTAAEEVFVRKVRELHPDSPKPVIVGNCQGGWAAMMMAASYPDDTGPIVINGAPMSYWAGAWREGEGDNPMRYAAGLLGGTWLASLAADLGDGIFDGAWLVQNFEYLNPANTFWNKYYRLFENVDTETPRFVEFERWWGGFYLMNRQEIEWITRNLFVGNKLWSGGVSDIGGHSFDFRQIKSPIVLFASLGDNITPPQQAFNWVVDVYGSTEEVKARGQVIVGLLHQDAGHLGIFVSGKVAKKEYTKIFSVLKSIEALQPGLYGMEIIEKPQADGRVSYDVQFIEHRLEEIAERLNRFKRMDEKPFQAVEKVSEFNQRAYELFARPLLQQMSNEVGAKLVRALHPLRMQRWAISDLNPWLAWLGPLAESIRSHRQPLKPEFALRRTEWFMSECVSSALDFYRDVRDAISEALFYEIYGPMFGACLAGEQGAGSRAAIADPRELPLVKEALASIKEGGYAEAVARVFALLLEHGKPFPLRELELGQAFEAKYARLLPRLSPERERRVRGEQDIIVRYAPERALETLPHLLCHSKDRDRLLTLMEAVLAETKLGSIKPTPKQLSMFGKIQGLLKREPKTNRPCGARQNGRRDATWQTNGGKRNGITHKCHV
jgi:pimeloyl-ACP methyl ester carboxylesterase